MTPTDDFTADTGTEKIDRQYLRGKYRMERDKRIRPGANPVSSKGSSFDVPQKGIDLSKLSIGKKWRW